MSLILKSLVTFAIALSSVSSQTTVVQLPMVFGTDIGNSSVNTFSDADYITPGEKVYIAWIHEDKKTKLVDGFGFSFYGHTKFDGVQAGEYDHVVLGNDGYVTGVTCVVDGSGIHYLEYRTLVDGKNGTFFKGVKSKKTILAGMIQDAPEGAHVPYQLAGFFGGERDGKFVHMTPIWTIFKH